ncbi:MAG: hypothetical protein KF832_02515 [Caldilineaceae bacterium]|nr:hypothetical protein [Caldilineaceae bacterium]
MRFLRPVCLPLSLAFSLVISTACALPPPMAERAAVVREYLALDAFANQLTTALAEHDYAQLQQLMGPTFVIANWRADGKSMPAQVATVQLRNHYLQAGNAIAVPATTDWETLLSGKDPLALWGTSVQVTKAVYVTGLGNSQQDEAILVIAEQPDGSPYWHGMLVASGGFQAKAATIAQGTTETAAETFSTTAMEAATSDTRPHIQLDGDTLVTTIHGVVQPAAQQEYILQAPAGETLSLVLTSSSGQASFTLAPLDAGPPLPTVEPLARYWSGTLAADQAYLVTVHAKTPTPFQLQASLETEPVTALPDAAPVRLVLGAGSDTTTVTEQLGATERRRYLVRATAGQNLFITLTSSDNTANFSLQGVTDGRPLKRLENEERSWSGSLPLTQDYLIMVTAPTAAVEYTVDLVIQ